MAMETIVALAIAMGRTLVLPPAQGMYLLMKDKKKQATDFTFANFFPMMKMAQENSALEVITMEEFLLLEAMTGNLVDKNTGLPSFPPDNRTDWDGHDVKVLKEWLRNVTYIEHFWKPGSCLAAFPATGNPKDVAHLKEWMQQLQSLMSKDDAFKFRGNPVPVDGPAKDRLHEALASRRELCVYDDFMQNQLVVHFMCYHKMRIRYLVHFYAFLFFENWKHDLWLKRFLRDHMRYVDEIQCAAARIVAELRQRALASSSSPNFDTMHIRRGDFQFKDTRISAEEIIANSADVLTINKTLYVATDERDKTFFRPIQAAGYKLYFLDDFRDLLQGVNTNYYGMIDQLIASQGEIFLGCWHSTFTGYIMRLRGVSIIFYVSICFFSYLTSSISDPISRSFWNRSIIQRKEIWKATWKESFQLHIITLP
jgi:GDP-fucose protein O-fucosyltransferase